MDHPALVESDSTSDVDDQTKAWESDPRPVTQRVAREGADEVPRADQDNPVECGIGHRVQTSRSVLALVLDEECVFAGLQGGDIVVCLLNQTFIGKAIDINRLGRSIPMTLCSLFMRTRRVC